MSSEARQKKNMVKLNRAQKCSILGPQNPGPRPPPPDPHLYYRRNYRLQLPFTLLVYNSCGGSRISQRDVHGGEWCPLVDRSVTEVVNRWGVIHGDMMETIEFSRNAQSSRLSFPELNSVESTESIEFVEDYL